MDSYRHVSVLEPSLKEGDRYNLHFERFMLNPLRFDLATEAAGEPVSGEIPLRFKGEAHAFAERVDALVERFSATDDRDLRTDVARELVVLHADGSLLWPMTLLFGLSTLGNGSRNLVPSIILAASPELESIRKAFEGNARFGTDSNAMQLRRNMSLLVIGMRFASTARIDGPDDFRSHHLQLVVDVYRPNGILRERVSKGAETAIGGLATHYGRDVDVFGAPAVARKRNKVIQPPVDRGPNAEWLLPAWLEWMKGKNLLVIGRHARALELLMGFLATLPPESCATPEATFVRRHMKALIAYIEDWSTPTNRGYALTKIREFSEWLSFESIDDLTGAPFRPQLFQQDIDRLKAKWGSPDRIVKREMTRPMPLAFHQILKEIIAGDDFAWPKSLTDRVTGRSTQWFAWHGPNGELRREFCPVMSRLLLLLLDMPIRGVQARRLDSGEGDDRRWDAQSDRWVANQGRHAGHWRRNRARNVARGVIHEIVDKGRTITGLWINSNKTQDRRTLCDETSGQKIPWENPVVLTSLDAMRGWQETYNPVDGPLPHRDLSRGIFTDDPTDLVARHIPDRFYLFRSPLNVWPGGNREPPSHDALNAFFLAALEELERRWNSENPEDPIQIIVKRDAVQTPLTALFTIHGMRSATLTGLHRAGVPIGIISRMVAGHASILMTLGYMHYEPQHVSDVINEARLKFDSCRQGEFQAFLRRASFQDAVRKTAGVGDGITVSRDGGVDLSLCSRLDIGICPNGGTKCAEGGPKVERRRTEVPGGPRNCIRCRFFVTGYPFLIPLWAHGNALLARADGFARQAKEQEDEVVRLKGEKAKLRAGNEPIPSDLTDRIRAVNEAYLSTCSSRDSRFDDFHVALDLIEKVRALGPLEDADPADPTLPTRPRAEVPEVKGRRASRYEVTDAVVHAGRFYPSLASPDIERERDGFTDRIAYHGGYVPPSLSALGQAERRMSADGLARLFLSALDAAEVEHLIEGSKRLSDHPGLEERFRRVCLETTGKEAPRIETPAARPRLLKKKVED